MDILKAMKILAVKDISNQESLKEAWKQAALVHHPDRGGNKEDFIAAQDAYKFLSRGEYLQKTVCGESLTNLGNGFPLTYNATTCPSCDGNGYNTWASVLWSTCPTCKGKETISIETRKCPTCNGTKTFNEKPCFNCKGKGVSIFILPFQRKCPDCDSRNPNGLLRRALNSLQTIDYNIAKKFIINGLTGKIPRAGNAHYKCGICKGVGEVLLFNPVLKRSLFHKSSS
jgi:DnaJ-class molecular chaperone